MKYLLDTHTFLWSVLEPKALPKRVTVELKKQDNEIFVSSVSLWEISIKIRIGKMELKGLSADDLVDISERMNYGIINMTAEDALGYVSLGEKTHKDPFDRMLIWQSISRKFAIISKDSAFKKFIPFGLKLLWE